MSATGSEPGAGGGPADAHAYFRAVEDAFIRLRGAPFLLSPEDWRVASGWWDAGVPLELVERVLEKLLSRREEAEAGQARRVRSLRYFDSAVAAAWKGRRAVAGSAEARHAAPLDVDAALTALAGSLPAELPGRAELARRIGALGGDSEEIENELTALDREMLAAAGASLSEERRATLARRVDAALERVGARLSPEEAEVARRRLERQVLRRMLDLPLLSLFSPQAR